MTPEQLTRRIFDLIGKYGTKAGDGEMRKNGRTLELTVGGHRLTVVVLDGHEVTEQFRKVTQG